MVIIVYNHHLPLVNNSLKLISGILLLQFKKWRVREKRDLLNYIQDLILLRPPGSDRSHLSPGFLNNLCLLSLFLSLPPSPHHYHPKIATWVVLLEILSQITYFLWSKSFNVSALFLKVKVKTFTMACKVLHGSGPYPVSDLIYTCCPSGYSALAILASWLVLNMTSMVLPQELSTSARNPLPIYNLMTTSLISLMSLLKWQLLQRPTLTPLLNSTTWLFLPPGKQMALTPIQ